MFYHYLKFLEWKHKKACPEADDKPFHCSVSFIWWLFVSYNILMEYQRYLPINGLSVVNINSSYCINRRNVVHFTDMEWETWLV